MSAAAPARPAAPAFAPGMATQNAPPLALPAEHFLAALAFFVAGSLGLVAVAPELAAGLFPLPRVAAVTHCFTLGWITTSILGALYQFLPVALGVPIRSRRLAHATFALFVPGLALFVAGLAAGRPAVLVPGAALFGTALLLFAGNLAATLRRATERGLTWWALVGAAAFLVLTVLLGVALAGNLRWGYLGGSRFLALAVHIHVAIFGWVMLVVIGVANRLLPMFLLSHGVSERRGRIAAGLVASGVLLLFALHHAVPMPLLWLAPGALILAGTAAFLLQARAFYRHRRKPKIDAGMRSAAVALAFLAFALGLAPVALVGGAGAPRLAVAYVAALVLGALSLFVAALYYKIIPFLIWFHRFGPLAGKRPLPTVAELFDARWATLATALLALGAAGVVAGVLAGSGAGARAAAAVFAAGALAEAAQIVVIFRRRPA
ncbi:MAG TPA: hypothetical protein VFQ38_09345 [Longimicrobiales bacterium]|nr:hypothetical protein [Longimicrobiales bacterium]